MTMIFRKFRAAGKDFSFVISFDPAKEITSRSKIRNAYKNIAMQRKMRIEYRDKKTQRVTRHDSLILNAAN
jgi:hypothetical protein